jgi:hypothetical protein
LIVPPSHFIYSLKNLLVCVFVGVTGVILLILMSVMGFYDRRRRAEKERTQERGEWRSFSYKSQEAIALLTAPRLSSGSLTIPAEEEGFRDLTSSSESNAVRLSAGVKDYGAARSRN